MNDLHTTYFDIQKSFSEGSITFDKYCQEIFSWNRQFSDIIKAQTQDIDGSRGGRLIKKKVIDKKGKQVTKWVKPNESDGEKGGKLTEDKASRRRSELEITKKQWEANLATASDTALKNASKYAVSEDVRRMARNELFKRSFNLNKYLDMSLMPDFMLDDYVGRYNDINSTLTEKEQKSIESFLEVGGRINKKIIKGDKLDNEETSIKQGIERAINKSKLINDVVLYRGINTKDSLMFINYLKSLKPGDIYEEETITTPSLLQSNPNQYSSTGNLSLKIFASKGQNALCMQGDKNYNFALSSKSKFQIIESDKKTISVKLLD